MYRPLGAPSVGFFLALGSTPGTAVEGILPEADEPAAPEGKHWESCLRPDGLGTLLALL